MKNFGGLAFYRNIIASGFECKENDPAPVGGGNSISSKVDQCAGSDSRLPGHAGRTVR